MKHLSLKSKYIELFIRVFGIYLTLFSEVLELSLLYQTE
jgi:hypothetical protein